MVWFDLHPGIVSPHFLISPVLGALSTVLLVRLYDGDSHVRLAVPPRLLGLYVPLAAVGFVVLVLGTLVTGTGPHSGDAGDVTRLMFSPVVITRVHAVAVYLFPRPVDRDAGRPTARVPAARPHRGLVAVAATAQGAVGIQYFGLPGWSSSATRSAPHSLH